MRLPTEVAELPAYGQCFEQQRAARARRGNDEQRPLQLGDARVRPRGPGRRGCGSGRQLWCVLLRAGGQQGTQHSRLQYTVGVDAVAAHHQPFGRGTAGRAQIKAQGGVIAPAFATLAV